jgi:hypothetical protein
MLEWQIEYNFSRTGYLGECLTPRNKNQRESGAMIFVQLIHTSKNLKKIRGTYYSHIKSLIRFAC